MRRSGLVGARGPADAQGRVDAHFDVRASLWRDMYARQDVYAVIHQHRQELALALIDGLELRAGTSALEVGCGAGLMTVALARRGLRVQATDAAAGMVEATRDAVAAAELSSVVTASQADAHSLAFGDGEFGLVVAMGVVPWLHSPARALAEMARVLSPGGYLLVNADNRRRLNNLLDPVSSPVLAPVRRAVEWVLRKVGIRRREPPLVTMHTTREFDRLTDSLGFERISGTTFGFGPFTLARRKLLPDRLGVAVHRALQRGCDRGIPGLRSTGSQYLVLARKRADDR